MKLCCWNCIKWLFAHRYYAGDGFCMKQCRPVRDLRYLLLALSLVSADDVRDEEAAFLVPTSELRQISVGDEMISTPSGKNRKHHAIFSTSCVVHGSCIPNRSISVQELTDWLAKLGITWNYDHLTDAHP